MNTLRKLQQVWELILFSSALKCVPFAHKPQLSLSSVPYCLWAGFELQGASPGTEELAKILLCSCGRCVEGAVMALLNIWLKLFLSHVLTVIHREFHLSLSGRAHTECGLGVDQCSMQGPSGWSDELPVALEKDTNSSPCQTGKFYTFIH